MYLTTGKCIGPDILLAPDDSIGNGKLLNNFCIRAIPILIPGSFVRPDGVESHQPQCEIGVGPPTIYLPVGMDPLVRGAALSRERSLVLSDGKKERMPIFGMDAVPL